MFWGEFRRPLAALDRCTLNKGSFAFKIVRGALKWPLKGGSRLIEVAATAGLTVFENIMEMEHLLFWSKCSNFHNIFKSIQSLNKKKTSRIFSMLSKNRK